MTEIFTYLSNFVLNIIKTTGYTGIFLLSFLDRVTVFLIPAEIVIPTYGILISQGKFIFWPVFLWVTAGNFLGNLALYYIFMKGGRPFLEKYGRYFLISKHELVHLDRWFIKYGDKLVLFGYLIPTAVRSLVPIPAGLSQMKLFKFSLYTFIGSLPLNFLYLYVGVKAGDNLSRILYYLEKLNYVIIAVILILVIRYIYRHMTGKHLTHNSE